jgi:fermentation-respiration switch protein FrsA (DUF1100 family)
MPDLAAFLILPVTGLLWLLLGMWIPGGSERFYLLVPPAFLAYFLLTSAAAWKELKQLLPIVCTLLAVLTLLCSLYGRGMTSWAGGDSDELFPSSIRSEVLLAVYFSTAVILLVLGTRDVLRRLAARFAGASEMNLRLNDLRLRLGDTLVVAVLFAVGVPYVLSILYVHRFKVPNAKPPADSEGRSFEDVSFQTDDGLTIRGWFIPADETSERTLVICHGLGANRSMFLPYLEVGHALRANVLLFDFRDHGASDGHTVSFGGRERLDVLAAVRYLRAQRPAQAREVIGLGISMGASALTLAAADIEPPLEAVILDSGFASALDLTDSVLGAFPAVVRPWLALLGVPLASLHAGCWLPGVRPVDRIAAVRAPVLIIHAGEDRLIPPFHAERLYRSAVEPKTRWITPSGGHGAALFVARAEYVRLVRQLVGEKAGQQQSPTLMGQ